MKGDGMLGGLLGGLLSIAIFAAVAGTILKGTSAVWNGVKEGSHKLKPAKGDVKFW